MNCVDFTQLYVKGLLIYHVKLVVFLIPAHTVVIPLAKYILPYVEHLILSNRFFLPELSLYCLQCETCCPFHCFIKLYLMDKNRQNKSVSCILIKMVPCLYHLTISSKWAAVLTVKML